MHVKLSYLEFQEFAWNPAGLTVFWQLCSSFLTMLELLEFQKRKSVVWFINIYGGIIFEGNVDQKCLVLFLLGNIFYSSSLFSIFLSHFQSLLWIWEKQASLLKVQNNLLTIYLSMTLALLNLRPLYSHFHLFFQQHSSIRSRGNDFHPRLFTPRCTMPLEDQGCNT